MPEPFEALRENLLRAGVAPRHVRAYLAELRDHLADLSEREGGDAVAARARLGDDAALAAAMLARPGVRSLTARAPWLVLGLLQPLAMIAVVVLASLLSVAAYVLLWGALGMDVGQLGPDLAVMGNLLAVPLAALLFAMIAWRQRVSPAWLLAGSVIVLLLFPHMGFWHVRPDPLTFPPGLRLQYSYARQFSAGAGVFPVFHPRAWAMMAAHWPIVMAQYALTLLPAGWLWFSARKTA